MRGGQDAVYVTWASRTERLECLHAKISVYGIYEEGRELSDVERDLRMSEGDDESGDRTEYVVDR